MSSNGIPAAQMRTRPDSIKFLYDDGLLPVANVHARVIALGKGSDPRSDIADDFVAWGGTRDRTDGNGEVWLSNPKLLDGMALLEQVVKRQNKSLNGWYYAPELDKRPADIPGAPRSPRIPLVIEIDDDGVGAPTLRIPLIPQTVVTTQSRPPIGELNGTAFMDPWAFVRQLAQRLSAMGRDRSAISLKLNRVNSPDPEIKLQSAWRELEFALGTTRSDLGKLTSAFVKQFRNVRDHIGTKVLQKLLPAGSPSKKSVADSYVEI